MDQGETRAAGSVTGRDGRRRPLHRKRALIFLGGVSLLCLASWMGEPAAEADRAESAVVDLAIRSATQLGGFSFHLDARLLWRR